jgi:ribulose-5-phosphate 4-epimerase/fuculose-1-phosphate aldolase
MGAIALVPQSQVTTTVADLGTTGGMILRNHGTLAVGATVGECFVKLYFI